MFAATLLAATAQGQHDVSGVLCTLLWIVFVVAVVLAAVGLIVSLVGGTTGWGRYPIFTNWLAAAAVALVSGLLLLFLC